MMTYVLYITILAVLNDGTCTKFRVVGIMKCTSKVNI